jgi:hypothetical protein
VTLATYTRVEVDVVLAHLVAQTNAPSSMGTQLEQLSTRTEARRHGPGWGTHARFEVRTKDHDAEGAVLRDAAAYRVLQGFAAVKDSSLDCDALRAVCGASTTCEPVPGCTWVRTPGLGAAALKALRAFQAALAAPSDEDLERAERRAAKAPADKRAATLQKAIAEYRAPRGLDAVQVTFKLKSPAQAAEVYADAMLLLSMYVQEFNRLKGKK